MTGCEWNPDTNAPAHADDVHNTTVPATIIVGVDPNWFLCASCSALARFRRYRVRRPMLGAPAVLSKTETPE